MKTRAYLLIALLFTLTAGCYPTYVGNPEKSALDDHLPGVWHLEGAEEQLWFVHSLDKHSYLVQQYQFEQKDGKPALKSQPLTMRAWVTPLAGKQFISLEVFAPQFLIAPEDPHSKDRYIVATYSADANTVTAKGISGDFFKKYNITTPSEFEKALTEHDAEPGTYIDPNVYNCVDVKNPGNVKPLLDLLNEQNR